MNRRWALLTVVAVAAVPLAASCTSSGSDDDDVPADPSVSLFRGTPNPNVSTDITG